MLLRFEVEWHRSRRGADNEAIGAVDLGPLGSEPAFFGRRSDAVEVDRTRCAVDLDNSNGWPGGPILAQLIGIKRRHIRLQTHRGGFANHSRRRAGRLAPFSPIGASVKVAEVDLERGVIDRHQ